MNKRITITIMAIWALILVASAAAESHQYHYRYWDWAKTPRRDNFQYAALKLALEKTQSSHGMATTERVEKEFSTLRSRRELNRDKTVNVRAGPWVMLKGESPAEDNLRIPIPILDNLLGYRRILIRKADLGRFEGIQQRDQLQQLKVGQGRTWQDVAVYERNQFKVAAEGSLTALPIMLHNKRFDFLPLSVIEIDLLLAGSGPYAASLAIAPNVVVYYPLPVIFYVSRNRPELAERLHKGLLIAKEDGSLRQLQLAHFSKEIELLQQTANRYFVLENPYIPQELAVHKPIFAPPNAE